MEIKTILSRLFYTNMYLLRDEQTGKCAIIDPGEYSDELVREINAVGKENIEYILLTHGHFDHIYGVDAVKKLTGAKLVISKQDAEMLDDPAKNACMLIGANIVCEKKPDNLLDDGDEITLGSKTIKVMSTPGHSKGSVCFLCENAIFSGDTVFNSGHGRTDLYGGSDEVITRSILRLAAIDGDMDIYPGHDIPTSLSYERKHNPKLR